MKSTADTRRPPLRPFDFNSSREERLLRAAAKRHSAQRSAAIFFTALHLLVLGFSTLLATIHIESIIGTGAVNALTGGATAVALRKTGYRGGVLAALSTLAIAVVLFPLEAWVLQLGPQRAYVPFCVLFLANQITTSVILLRTVRSLSHDAERAPAAYSMHYLFFQMIGIAVACSAIAALPESTESRAFVFAAAVGFGATVATLVAIWVDSRRMSRAAAPLVHRAATKSPPIDSE